MTMRPLTYILTLLAFGLIVVAAIPQWRQSLRDKISPDQREIVAKITGSVSARGPHFIILKIKNRDQYFIEVYKNNETLQLVQRIALEEPLDGRFHFQGRYTNLAMADIDIDDRYEIVVPMYDKNATPRLLIYQYNEAIESFEKITGE